MDVLERIRRGYGAVGPGAPRDLLAMFHQEEDAPPDWVVYDTVASGRTHASREVVATDLFGGLPDGWEVIGVELRLWDVYESFSKVVVGERFRARPRGTWEVMTLPFVHIWTYAGEQVETVLDYLAGIEVRRLDAVPERRGLRRWKRAS